MANLVGKSAVITGASQGIGQAIAGALHAAGVNLVLIGRDLDRLQSAVSSFGTQAPPPHMLQADLGDPGSLQAATDKISEVLPGVDILIHCGGAYLRGDWDELDPPAFSNLLDTNVIGPYTLTRQLLPRLVVARGDVVFVNSTVTRSQGMHASHFKVTQHALQALADTFRTELNAQGLRVLSIYPGRTATPRQQEIYRDEGRDYRPERLLQPEDVADAVLSCLSMPATAEITDLYIRPRLKT
ncbi:SDR family NAD(P)-dependent oxidoreductase [Lentisalinibacter orientalis]|uniref:SDR family NAD(P)-dependent oxidoreductase n=1 Tax=Lentisalinibacter orientalis TaxID=2992241 RepID=UPI00386BDCF9